jgi:uncharacterized repeat protein (TIGR03806 family)
MSDSLTMARLRGGTQVARPLMPLVLALWGCGSLGDPSRLYEPGIGDPGPRPPAFLNLPPDKSAIPRAPVPPPQSVDADAAAAAKADAYAKALAAGEAAGFPTLLSETGVFSDLVTLKPRAGLIPYDLNAPLWSDGAYKVRWVSLPEYGAVSAPDDGPWQFPAGTIFVKHFEMAFDANQPDVRQRLETRLLVAASSGDYYGVTYKWNDAQTDATLVLEKDIETLPINDADGNPEQYFFPGPNDCVTCHASSAGRVLGVHTRQLNKEISYLPDTAAVNELVAWSGWGLLADTVFDDTSAEAAPQLAALGDEDASLEDRVRSYWDGNCSMCHAGTDGSQPGWDARFSTPLDAQGVFSAPSQERPDVSLLISPGDKEHSYIYLRGTSDQAGVRMPPLGRYIADQRYVDVLGRWIDSLPPSLAPASPDPVDAEPANSESSNAEEQTSN